MSNHFYTSDGERVSKSTIDSRVRNAKEKVLEDMLDEYGYIFCTDCQRNSNCGEPIDCSHTISVDEAQKSGKAELAWDTDNIKPRCRTCHNKLDGLYLDSGADRSCTCSVDYYRVNDERGHYCLLCKAKVVDSEFSDDYTSIIYYPGC